MHFVAVIVTIIGAICFVLSFASILSVGSLTIWGGVAVAGMLVTIMTRRPGS